MKCRVLLAHHHEIVRIGIRSLLSTNSDFVICGEAGDGVETISKVEELNPDIVVMHYGMPKANAYIISCRIQRSRASKKVLVLGAAETEPVVRALLRAGVRGLVPDSDPGINIVNAVDALSRDRTYFSSAVSNILIQDYLDPRGSTRSEMDVAVLLSIREYEVLQLLAEGRSTKELADDLGISVKTAETHRSTVMRKLGLHNIVQLTLYAVSRSVVTVPMLQSMAPTTADFTLPLDTTVHADIHTPDATSVLMFRSEAHVAIAHHAVAAG
jgi:DNA-binding NarL/FixJ family response regulator